MRERRYAAVCGATDASDQPGRPEPLHQAAETDERGLVHRRVVSGPIRSGSSINASP